MVVQNKAISVAAFSSFDLQVPSILVFAILMGSMPVALVMAREESMGTLSRLKLTRMRSFDLLFGTTMPFTILGVAQVLILLGVAIFMGYNYNAAGNLWLVIFIALWGILATIALGLIMAALSRDEDQAAAMGPAIVLPLSFLTSAFFPMPTVTLTRDFMGTGRPFELYDWLPWTQCSKALAKVLTFGAGPDEVVLELGLMMLTTVVLFAFSVALYHNRRLKAL